MNALNAYNKLNANVAGLKKASEKLSSGYRINRAGDDAAGLAISEKMRSQIRGLNQAKRNAQDGISMMQTFEGAAQETHTILQRMKELATESANGTYDNSTDRAAIQLEFDQLNDELNQLADTDFNGTIVLNGGVMSDGLEDVDGMFDYKYKKGQITDAALAQIDKEIADASSEKLKLEQAYAKGGFDLSASKAAPEWDDVDDNAYDKAVADKLWKDLALTDNDAQNGNVDLSKGKKVTLTFEYTDTGWKVQKGFVSDGLVDKELTKKQLDDAQITVKSKDVGNATGQGGFIVKSKSNNYEETLGKNPLGNAIFDASEVHIGDTVTLVYENDEKTQEAPTNIGFNGADTDQGDAIIYKPDANHDTSKSLSMSAVLGTDLTDIKMTQEIYDALDALDGSKVELSWAGTADGANPTIKIGGQTIAAVDGDGTDFTLDGVKLFIKADNATGAQNFTVSMAKEKTDGTFEAGQTLFKLNFTKAEENVKGTAEGTLSIQNYSFSDPTDNVAIKVGSDLNGKGTSKALKDQIAVADSTVSTLTAKRNAMTAKGDDGNLTEAAWNAIKEYYGVANGVSVSDAFDKSTAIMTYAENIILQTGARSKDAVNFTFNYNKADMGNLQPNLNLSARAEGLNTKNLSLATAKDANEAIDQIDKAINKTSMVRASFGAIQNRLDYKIENLTTTSENLTEAESNIRDTDMANEMLNYTKFNILQQAAQSMLAQANQQPQSILQLLG